MNRRLFAALLMLTLVSIGLAPASAVAGSASEIEAEAKAALAQLYGESKDAKMLGEKAKAILVFPKIVKAGLLIGGQYGEGALFQGGKTAGYFSSGAVSYGLQAGVQWFGYAMFLMDDEAVNYLDSSDGWEIGSGPSVVAWDEGLATTTSSTTLTKETYVFTFDQEGLMAGLGLQGTKITKIQPGE